MGKLSVKPYLSCEKHKNINGVSNTNYDLLQYFTTICICVYVFMTIRIVKHLPAYPGVTTSRYRSEGERDKWR